MTMNSLSIFLTFGQLLNENRHMRTLLSTLFIALLLAGCYSTPKNTAKHSTPILTSGSGEPTKQEAMRIALHYQYVKLSDMKFCESDLPNQNEKSDLGDLFSYIFAEYGAGYEKQHTGFKIIEETEPHPEYSGKLWKIIILQHVYVEADGAYAATGISFLIKDVNHEAIRSSFTCAGFG